MKSVVIRNEFEFRICEIKFEIDRIFQCPNFQKFQIQSSKLLNLISMHTPVEQFEQKKELMYRGKLY